MTISVIVVSWNAKSFLLACLQSILGQTSPHAMEVIVVDNASTDGSPEAVAAIFPTVRLIRNDANLGFAKANNIGIRASSGDYLFLINSDVIVGAGCFTSMTAYMDAHQRTGLMGPRITGPDGRVQRSCMAYPLLWNTFARALALDRLAPGSKLLGGQLLTFWRHDTTQAVDVINGCFWLLRRSALDDVGLLDERFLMYGEDIDWCKRFNEHGWRVDFYADATAIHFGGASSANSPVIFYVEMQRATYQYWQKHHTRVRSSAFLAINILHHAVRMGAETLVYLTARRRRRTAAHNIARAWASLKWAGTTATALILQRSVPLREAGHADSR